MSKADNLFRPTEYFKATSVEEAVKLLARYDGEGSAIAGGTDLLVEKNPQVEALIDITDLGLNYIKFDGQRLTIGATTTFADIEASPVLYKSPYNALAQAARQMGTPQIRNVATIGGNVCSAVPSADSAPALLVLGATLNIAGPAGERVIDISDFFLDVRKNALDRSELVTEIQLPAFPVRTEAVFMKQGRVGAGDLAIVNTAVRLTMSAAGVCQEVRIALGAVAPTPLRVKEAEAMLQEEEPQDELLRRVAERATEEIKPISDVRSSAEYRMTLSRILVEQALKEAVAKLVA